LTKSKSPAVYLKTAGSRGFPGGKPGLIFFRPFFVQRQRKDNHAFSERAKLGEPVEEVAENLDIKKPWEQKYPLLPRLLFN
jgi:hypothetical protein